MFAQIAVFKSLGDFATLLTYQVPEADFLKVRPGMLARFKFRGLINTGIIVSLSEVLPDGMALEKIKPLETVYESIVLSPAALEAAQILAKEYVSSLSDFLKLFLPQKLRKGLPKLVPHVAADFKSFPLKPLGFELTPEQALALEGIRNSKKPVLLHGLTGTGKTEIYLRAILDCVKAGKQAILLLPEIALTPQMLRYFKDAFGEHLAVFHSHLSETERLSEWWKVKSGYAPMVIGSRSAIFAPCENLGLIIMDEEHEWTYKQESSPYYHARAVAEVLARITGAVFVLGSATPSAEAYQKTILGEYEKVQLKERIGGLPFPPITIVDLRQEFQKRNFSIFSHTLQQKIQEKLSRGEQIILFVNQRGLYSAVICRDCGAAEECPNCKIALKVHGKGQSEKLLCHTCRFSKSSPLECSKCGSVHIRFIGVGTQRVEEEVKSLFPTARVLRADQDSLKAGTSFESIYETFLAHRADILIGTQMVAKGLDFSKVSLVGIVLADIGLHLPDFRAHEKLFQLLIQVSGRSGRGAQGGEVVLQTYQPDHPAILKAAAYDYEGFMKEELRERESLFYPPFSRMALFQSSGDPAGLLETLKTLFKERGVQAQFSMAPNYDLYLRTADLKPLSGWKAPKGVKVEVDPLSLI